MEQRYTQETSDKQSIMNYYLGRVAELSPDLYPQILRVQLNKPILSNKVAFLNTKLVGTA